MKNQLIHDDCLNYMQSLPDNCIDAIVTDPPYLYLKHKLDCPFDEQLFFSEAYRVLKDDSFLVFFGRGESYFRWNYICNQLGFKFKEEIIWDKTRVSNFMNKVARCHENASILRKGKTTFNDVRIDALEYAELAQHCLKRDLSQILCEIKRIKCWEDFKTIFIEQDYVRNNVKKHNLTISSSVKSLKRGRLVYKKLTEGNKVTSIARVATEHYNYVHPTQKPIELLKIFLNLCTNKNDLILDPFCGSGTTAIACIQTDRNWLCIEKDKEYYEIAKNRIDTELKKPKQLELIK